MFHINDDIKKPWKLSRAWFNAVAKFLNNVCGDGIINISRPDEPSAMTPMRWSLDIDRLRARLGGNSVAVPFEAKTAMTTASTPTVASVSVYLPAPKVTLSGQEWDIAGLATGFTKGWHVVPSSTGAGTLWLKLKRTAAQTAQSDFGTDTHTATFAYSLTTPADADGLLYRIADVAANGTVTQYGAPLAGVFTENSGATSHLGTTHFKKDSTATPDSTDTSRMHNDGVPTGEARFALKTDTWHIGDDNRGTRRLVVSRIEVDDEDDPAEHYLYFRCETRDPTGRVVDVSAELGCAKIMA